MDYSRALHIVISGLPSDWSTQTQRRRKQIESGIARIAGNFFLLCPFSFLQCPPVEGALHIPWVDTKMRTVIVHYSESVVHSDVRVNNNLLLAITEYCTFL